MNRAVTSDELLLVDLGERSYEILIGRRLLDSIADLAHGVIRGKRLMVVCDEAVMSPWGKKIARALSESAYKVEVFPIPAGETSKSPAMAMRLWEAMAAAEFSRECGVVAIGGGVAGDLAGFAAATYLRGIPYIQVPTTLLSMVDSSVGGKTGVNLEAGKNLVGSFWQPCLVVADLDVLGTLPERQVRSGLAEVVKYGVIRDAKLFALLEEHIAELFDAGNGEQLAGVIRRSVEIKAEVVHEDERESGMRAILNFGHTVGHALEAETRYESMTHGEAISIGMVAASMVAVRRGGTAWTQAEHGRLEALLAKAGLPTRMPAGLSAEGIVARTHHDKKVKGGVVRYLLPTEIGRVELVRDVAPAMVLEVLRDLGAE